ncbi:MAG: Bifunctional protein FolD protein [Candidatus Methanofastidiosum methylothiophilum]|jgi:methylenetetrahydrofolate dehydrogenase (NADP+)/methenyltetrahydrofolate cyclohydrolase|uniref:Bifunctional protein FolD n=1 Tax=Candidatus Methanofastidiosum methylothiophilum TaxID=1705564 RepID=A0A150JD87_9EURY|nr:MAG: Bifunctional protein FolD protein [Candidatus Methanofastidiosum methylthiophilus]OQC52620.1 MAG: Bifunctional protein FolD protein [Euryarchaeota archaeon ADurb.Bin023]HNV93983.1 bifunctional 5,10-methylenetetrahydrofolate dehydrogenase/5,10-methenyltetrahydrofolate cyclohydrolase [Methanofastidiosum sp.]KYC57409.1 MAG: Bifunctional protein FolD protein [Candidatus Methanofastidiosum methylthiophilus]KYC58195.1 MAG: Bifunctional protein FolD protein [Candidatus Methanofastidiosum methy
MSAMILDGKALAQKITDELSHIVADYKERGFSPKLATVLVGEDPASRVYVNLKKKDSEKIGIDYEEFYYKDISEEDLLLLIDDLNERNDIHGILVQLPLPRHIDSNKILERIDPLKDVDGFNPLNVGRILLNISDLFPCTPKGIVKILDEYKIPIEGSDITIINRSNIIGKPLAAMLINRGGTVTVVHSKTKNPKEKIKNADIVIIGVGKINFLTGDMVKEGAVVVDVGITRDLNGIRGDVKYDEVSKKTSYITPVPGGVGPMTRAMLLENLIICFSKQNDCAK